jgi:hypothetical protein
MEKPTTIPHVFVLHASLITTLSVVFTMRCGGKLKNYLQGGVTR